MLLSCRPLPLLATAKRRHINDRGDDSMAYSVGVIVVSALLRAVIISEAHTVRVRGAYFYAGKWRGENKFR
jgi:hypothetical protein